MLIMVDARLHTLEQLKSGQLAGVSRLQLAEDLTEFPREIFELADTLEILDLSNNRLSQLPDDLERLTQLRIIFASNNGFTALPPSLGRCTKLEMIGFKSNHIRSVPDHSLPAQTRWLILTDNQIEQLPEGMGELARLQKLMLAGNRLTQLPDSLSRCHNLQLLRLSANAFEQFPEVVLRLPKLAWLAFSGNPFCRIADPDHSKLNQSLRAAESVPQLPLDALQLGETLGQGASGVISRATWKQNTWGLPSEVAVKVFKGEVTSDGYPADELHACLLAGSHPRLIKPLARVATDECSALVMALIAPHFKNLGQPPSLTSCTRDTFAQGFTLEIHKIGYLVEQMTDLAQHLQRQQISHGDLYAHNVLVDTDGSLLFGDFGAASDYSMLSATQQAHIVRIEQRALGYFILDLLNICVDYDRETESYYSLECLAEHYLSGAHHTAD